MRFQNSVTLTDQDNPPVVQPIFHSVKYRFESFNEIKQLFHQQRHGYFYSRYANPTVAQLESELIRLQATEAGFLVGNGLAAITSCLSALLKPGDELVYFIESYRPTRVFIEQYLVPLGIKAHRLSLTDEKAIREVLQNKIQLIIFESPSNPQLQAAPIELILELAGKQKTITVLDNTLAGFHNHRNYDIDIYLHSLTKFASGHSDAMGGAILGRSAYLDVIRNFCLAMGHCLDPHNASLILRGLKTYDLRYQRACQSALKIANWLETHPAIETVFYPGLNSHPQFQQFCHQQVDFGSVIMFNLKDKSRPIETILDRTEHFLCAPSLGSTESLMVPVLYFYGGDLSDAERKRAHIDASSFRLAIGLEDPELLIQELDRLLDKSNA